MSATPRATVVRIDAMQLQHLLLRIEDVYMSTAGERIDSSVFYQRYRRGEFDEGPFFVAWSGFYEALLRMRGEFDEGAVTAVVDALAPVSV